MAGTTSQVKFDAPATLHEWPSLKNERRDDSLPYLVGEGTLDDCIRKLMAKPKSALHLYEIHTAPQPGLVTEILSAAHVAELARLRDYLRLPRQKARGEDTRDDCSLMRTLGRRAVRPSVADSARASKGCPP